MAILPVSSVKIDTRNSVKFGNNFENEEIIPEEKSSHNGAFNMATVPVVVLMAMNPSTLNTAAAMQEYDAEPETIEIAAPKMEEEIDEKAYVMSPEYLENTQVQNKSPFGWAIFKLEKIRMTKPATCNGSPYTMLFTSDPGHAAKDVTDIYFIKKGSNKGSNKVSEHPPKVIAFIYHDLGPGKEFCSVRTIEDVIDSDGNHIGNMKRELRLDDNSAQEIINLMTGYSQWNNKLIYRALNSKRTDVEPATFIKH